MEKEIRERLVQALAAGRTEEAKARGITASEKALLIYEKIEEANCKIVEVVTLVEDLNPYAGDWGKRIISRIIADLEITQAVIDSLEHRIDL